MASRRQTYRPSGTQETANLLEVSVHTVQEHIRRLYKRSGTRNRAELAECYRHVAPALVAMSLDEVPAPLEGAGGNIEGRSGSA